jgi:hypothetical protein
VKDIPFVLLLSGKFVLLRSERTIVSVQPSVNFLRSEGNTVGTFGAQILTDYIVDDGARFVVGVNAGVNGVFGSVEDDDFDVASGAAFLLSGHASFRFARPAKLLVEVITPATLGGGEFSFHEQGTVLNYGVRFFGESIAVDLAFVRPLDPDASSALVLGIPWVAFSARF